MPNIADLLLSDPRHIGVNYLPTASSPLLNAASFSNPLLASWFEQVSYIGAFGSSDNWLDGWTNFDPQNTDY